MEGCHCGRRCLSLLSDWKNSKDHSPSQKGKWHHLYSLSSVYWIVVCIPYTLTWLPEICGTCITRYSGLSDPASVLLHVVVKCMLFVYAFPYWQKTITRGGYHENGTDSNEFEKPFLDKVKHVNLRLKRRIINVTEKRLKGLFNGF